MPIISLTVSGLDADCLRNIYLKVKKAGGMKITFQAPPKYLDEKMLYNILRDYKMLNCEVLVRDEYGEPSRFLGVLMCCTDTVG